MTNKLCQLGIALLMPALAWAQETADTAATGIQDQTLGEVTVTARRPGVLRSLGPGNTQTMLKSELYKAACCNLGESFVTNPSVDVNYSDATTGARQIKLLGLSGTYVQMLAENLPAYRGAAMPYGLGYIPGPWMQSISVSKGNSSVKNGYEAMTGQINVEYVKPDNDQGATINLYANSMKRLEANFDANAHLTKELSTEVMGHWENMRNRHDGNSDGFQDEPRMRQYNLQNRWKYKGDNYLFHGGFGIVDEHRSSGQVSHHGSTDFTNHQDPWRTAVDTRRYEAYMKHALTLNQEHGTSLALMGNASHHELEAQYGLKAYSVNEKAAYGSLMLEHHFTPEHEISLGASISHDYLKQRYNLSATGNQTRSTESETTPGVYAQYTMNLSNRIIAMAGIRWDHSSAFGGFVTPRFHIKWQPATPLTLRLSAGKGYRTPHALAELNYLMASGRELVIEDLEQEAAWNYGAAASLVTSVANRILKVNAEYYYTRFSSQMLVDYDSNPSQLRIANLQGRSYSHTFQVDATYPIIPQIEITAAYRYNMVKSNYGGKMLWKPLQSRYKALLSASCKPDDMGLWQIDATIALNGSGRVPNAPNFKAYPNLTAQITRNFRHIAVYVGGENLTGYKQKTPILNSDTPWDSAFEPTLVYAPATGAMFYAGVRIALGGHVF